LPREEDEFGLSYYNSLSTWIDVRKLLAIFELTSADLSKRGESFGRESAKLPSACPRT